MTSTNPQPKKSKASSTAKDTVKAAADATTEPAAPARKRATKSKAAEQVAGSTAVTHEQRMAWIAEAAYYRAEKRGFTGSNDEETSDWLAAEAEVDAMLLSDKPKAD